MLVETLFAQADRAGHDIAVIDDTGPHSFQKLAGMAAAIGAYVAVQTDKPHVGIMLPASAGFVASFYGVLLAGKTVVPINFLLSEKEIAHVLADSGIDTVISIPILAAKLRHTDLKIIDLTQLAATPPAALSPKIPSKTADDVAVLIYTSGTVGLPKGVMLTYGNFQSDVDACIEYARLTQKYKFLGIIPLFHSFGITATIIAPIQLGATVVYQAKFNPAAVVAAIKEHGIALMLAIPSMYAALLLVKNAQPEDFKTMYAMICGGEPLPSTLFAAFQQRFGQTLYEGYGLTETSAPVMINMPHCLRPGSVGKPVPGVDIRIVDDNGNPVKPGETGDLWVRGPMIMKGYYHLPDATAKAINADGYFNTGDIARQDADGFVYITGRKKDLIIVAGEKAVPREIEEAILRNPAVAVAAVVGKKDAARGEVVVAFVTAREGQSLTADAVRETCRAAGLPQWKIPREVFIEAELPRTPTGKILKRELSERVNKIV